MCGFPSTRTRRGTVVWIFLNLVILRQGWFAGVVLEQTWQLYIRGGRSVY